MEQPNDMLPDFDEMEALAAKVARARAELVVLKHSLSSFQASLIREAKTNKQYWIGNKMPTDTFCKNVIMYTGNTDADSAKLLSLNNEIANKTEAYSLLQELIRIKRDRIDLFRTLSANSRKGFLDG